MLRGRSTNTVLGRVEGNNVHGSLLHVLRLGWFVRLVLVVVARDGLGLRGGYLTNGRLKLFTMRPNFVQVLAHVRVVRLALEDDTVVLEAARLL